MAELNGTAEPRFAAVQEALQANLDSGAELGASLVVDIDGERVVDIWGGYRDQGLSATWDENTITNVWSTTKTVTSLAALMLIDRGQLDPDAPVARYWPEFAVRGKHNVLVRHLLSHSSGVSGLEQPATVEDLYDARRAADRMAAQEPWWSPGTAPGYHLFNYGHLVGELVRRVSGKTLTQFVADEIAGPLGADFQIGAAERDWGRIAEIVPPPPLDLDLAAMGIDSPAFKTFTGPVIDPACANSAAWRRAEMGGVNGHGNARSVARILSVISRKGEVDGVRLLDPRTIDIIFKEQVDGMDVVLGIPLRWGIGFALTHPGSTPWIPDEETCFWGGWGGSMIIMDVGRRMTISYMMNKMAPGIIGSDRSISYVEAIYRALR